MQDYVAGWADTAADRGARTTAWQPDQSDAAAWKFASPDHDRNQANG